MLARDSDPCVPYADDRAVALSLREDSHVSGRRVAHRVLDEVLQDLTERRRVGGSPFRAWGNRNAKLKRSARCLRLDEGKRFARGRIEVGGDWVRYPATRFIARKVEEIVDNALHPHHVRLNGADELASLRRANVGIEQGFGKAADDGERRLQLVGHVG